MNFLLFSILVAQTVTAYFQFQIAKRLDKMNDFQREDAQVKATTEQVKQAGKRLPKQKE